VPSSDLVVDLRAGRPRVEPAPAPLLATVEVKTWLNATVIRLVLRLPEPARFLPGQFHLFELPGAGRRAYSMANLPNEDGRLEFLIKYKPGGAASKVLFEELAPGAQVLVEGPYGRGYLRPDPDRPLVAVAGGSGLAPMLSVVRGSRAGAASRSVTLYFGVNGPDELFCSHELEALLDDGVEVRWVLREGVHPTRAESVNGLVGDAMIAGEPTLSRKDLYLAGPAPMVEDVLRRTVREGLISADRVFFDRFQ
jgi:toluene monooxygenase electron transfer component